MNSEVAVSVPRMETISNTAKIFGLPAYFIKSKVLAGEIVAVKAGRKTLVNVEKFAEYLNSNKIRPAGPEKEESIYSIKPIKL